MYEAPSKIQFTSNIEKDILKQGDSHNPNDLHYKAIKDSLLRVYKVDWRWWWDSSSDNLSNYNSSNATTSYKTFVINTDSSGKGSFQFALTDEEWGRYLIRVADQQDGHATSLTVNIDWPIWSGKTRNRDASTANMLVFSTDKKNYAVGEKAQISFPSSEGGRALISIESYIVSIILKF